MPHLLSFIDGQNDDVTSGKKGKTMKGKSSVGINRFQINGYTLPVMVSEVQSFLMFL
jgi:hypothetical protein